MDSQKEPVSTADGGDAAKLSPDGVKSSADEEGSIHVHGEEMDLSEDDELVDEEEAPGEPWVSALLTHDYNSLSFEDKLAALVTLTNMALDGPTIRSYLDGRLETQHQAKKRQAEEAKVGCRAVWP